MPTTVLAAGDHIRLAVALRAGRWRGDYYAYENSGLEVEGATVGLVGYGAIGSRVAVPNVVITPHVAGASQETAEKAARIVASDVGRFLRGEPLAHCANRSTGDRGNKCGYGLPRSSVIMDGIAKG